MHPHPLDKSCAPLSPDSLQHGEPLEATEIAQNFAKTSAALHA